MSKGILVCLVSVMVACKGKDTATTSSSDKGKPSIPAQPSLRDMKPVDTIDATALAADFRNEARGAQLYSGKVYDIRGQLRRVITDDKEGPYLMLRGADRDVSCHFEPSELQAVAQLEADTTVTVRGVITGKTTGVVVFVKPCIVAPEPSADERERAELAKLTVKDVTLVDSSGKPLKDIRTGQTITKHLADCDALENDEKRVACQQLFFDVQQCGIDSACANKVVAAWVVKTLNGDVLDTTGAVITVNEVALINAEGKPLTVGGKPVTKKVGACSSLTGASRDTCEELFIDVSNCKIDTPNEGLDACIADQVRAWVDANPDAATN
jgi:hypothetical protein